MEHWKKRMENLKGEHHTEKGGVGIKALKVQRSNSWRKIEAETRTFPFSLTYTIKEERDHRFGGALEEGKRTERAVDIEERRYHLYTFSNERSDFAI